MKRSENELADRIERASPLGNPEGRYDLASKVEVRAYVAREVEKIKYDMARVPALEARIAELELSWWQKLKRWFSRSRRLRTLPVAEVKHSATHAEPHTDKIDITASEDNARGVYLGLSRALDEADAQRKAKESGGVYRPPGSPERR